MRTLVFIPLLLLALAFRSDELTVATVTLNEQRLYKLIMEYRKSKGLERIPLSNSLTKVAQIHSRDLANNAPDQKARCNMHSWSDKGKWTSCCYTSDHKQAECMWNKPRELTTYKGDGFEIAVGSGGSELSTYVITPESAMNSWKKSYHHNNVIVNRDIWKKVKWKAIGIGMYKGYATVWFGEAEDPEGKPDALK